jgi:hypothetical protein
MKRQAVNSSFPMWVAVASLGVALWLFFANAVPAVRERAELQALGDELLQMRHSYDEAIREARLGRGANARVDLQGLLVAIDRLGMTPAELCAAHPEEPAADSGQSRAR